MDQQKYAPLEENSFGILIRNQTSPAKIRWNGSVVKIEEETPESYSVRVVNTDGIRFTVYKDGSGACSLSKVRKGYLKRQNLI